MRYIIYLSLSTLLICSCLLNAAAPPPPTSTDTVYDTLHGVVVPDPYRWLETPASESQDVAAWTDSQWKYLRDYVDSYPARDRIEQRMAELLTLGSIGVPKVRDSLYFYEQRDTTQNHGILYMRRGLDSEPEVIIDPNTFSETGTTALDWYHISDDGSLIAYGKSESGSEKSTLHLLRTDDRTHLSDTIPYTRGASLVWLPDNSGFYYTRFATPGDVPEGDENYYRRVYYHQLGTDWESDPLIFGENQPKDAWTAVGLSPDGTKLFAAAYIGASHVRYYFKNLEDPDGEFIPLYDDSVRATFFVTPLNDRFLILTNFDAPRNRVFSGNYNKPELENWKEIIPERPSILDGTLVIANHIVTLSLKNAYSVVEIFELNGDPVAELEPPSIGSVRSINGEFDGDEMFYSFTSFNVPTTIYRYDFESAQTEQWARIDPGVEYENIVVNQAWYDSKDGTPVSMFIVHREGLELNGNNPVYLYGYGGFNVNSRPYFSRTLTFWFDHGGVFVYPNLRGGGEYGEEWHNAGKLENKQNTFDDFIAAAEYLIAQDYTRPDLICASGGSNGGLLTGAVLVQRPKLFGAVIVGVPLLDMLRYHRFSIARLWIPEYGSAEDSAQFQFLHAYSPYHNVEKDVDYPPVLLTAGASDSRVDPLHARKMAARLQAADTTPETPVLLRIEPEAGHGQGKPTSKRINEQTDKWVFVFKALGMSVQ